MERGGGGGEGEMGRGGVCMQFSMWSLENDDVTHTYDDVTHTCDDVTHTCDDVTHHSACGLWRTECVLWTSKGSVHAIQNVHLC